MPRPVREIIQQRKQFTSPEEEVLIALQMAASRVMEPWMQQLKAQAGLTPNQYNVLRILRGAAPEGLTCGEIGGRMITRDPDITRLVDRLVRSGLVRRRRSSADRRVVRVYITGAGLSVLAGLDAAVSELPVRMIGSLGSRRLSTLRSLLEEVIECASAQNREMS